MFFSLSVFAETKQSDLDQATKRFKYILPDYGSDWILKPNSDRVILRGDSLEINPKYTYENESIESMFGYGPRLVEEGMGMIFQTYELAIMLMSELRDDEKKQKKALAYIDLHPEWITIINKGSDHSYILGAHRKQPYAFNIKFNSHNLDIILRALKDSVKRHPKAWHIQKVGSKDMPYLEKVNKGGINFIIYNKNKKENIVEPAQTCINYLNDKKDCDNKMLSYLSPDCDKYIYRKQSRLYGTDKVFIIKDRESLWLDQIEVKKSQEDQVELYISWKFEEDGKKRSYGSNFILKKIKDKWLIKRIKRMD
jgi:hypothetical protein